LSEASSVFVLNDKTAVIMSLRAVVKC